MMRSIEITSWQDFGALSDLSASIWSEQEPGFQIEGVKNIDELMFVLESLESFVPENLKGKYKFDSAYPRSGFGHFMSVPEQAHVDDSLRGLAVHHNISDNIPVRLGFTLGRIVTPNVNEGYNAFEVRQGNTLPGRLTVFSEGWPGYMLKARHLFKRHKNRPNKWARYGQERKVDGGAKSVSQIATESFDLIRDYT